MTELATLDVTKEEVKEMVIHDIIVEVNQQKYLFIAGQQMSWNHG